MKLKSGLSLAFLFGAVISFAGTGATAQAAVVTGGNALGGFSVLYGDNFNNASTEELYEAMEL